MSGEHVWSRWTHKYIAYNPSRPAGKALVAVDYRDRTEFRRVPMPPDPRQWKAHTVCARCNNGWMSDLENRVKPILIPLFSGQPARLGREEQSQIAAWITLKTMVCEFDRLGEAVSHHAQRKRLMVRHLPPAENLTIWIGHYKRSKWVPLWICHPFLILSKERMAKRSTDLATFFNSQAVTYVFSELFVHVIQSPDKKIVADFRLPPPGGTKLRRIWPPSNYSIVWPPPTLIDVEADRTAGALRALARHTAGIPGN